MASGLTSASGDQNFREDYLFAYAFSFSLNSRFRDVVGRTLSNMPPDPTDAEDSLHAELMQGRTKHALAMAAKIDNWLAAHVADLMVPIGLLDTEIDDM